MGLGDVERKFLFFPVLYSHRLRDLLHRCPSLRWDEIQCKIDHLSLKMQFWPAKLHTH